MSKKNIWCSVLGAFCSLVSILGHTAPVTYNIDPSHTFPSFEADHWAGLSIWRGKINQSSGTIILDKEAETGNIDVTMQMASIDFGHNGMNERATAEIFHVEQFPTANYVGRLVNFEGGAPTAAEGTLTLHGVSRPVDLVINSFRCQLHFMSGKEVCGADVAATINRGDFGVDYDLAQGFFPEVKLMITVEARISE
ncbi:MAG: YceI family protein [Gammaproteobacteria bacterium]